MNSNTKALTALAAIILLFLLFHFIIHRPMSREYSRLQERNRELGCQLAQAQLEKDNLPSVKEKIETARRQLELVGERYPDSIGPFVSHITEAARLRGLVDIFCREKDPVSRDDLPGVEKRLISVEGHGGYRAVGEFLEELEKLPIRVSVSDLELESDEKAGTDVNLKLFLDVFLKKGT